MYKSLNEFEIRPDATTGFHGNHRVIMGKMKTSITSRMSSKFGQIGPRTAELAALERMKKNPIDL